MTRSLKLSFHIESETCFLSVEMLLTERKPVSQYQLPPPVITVMLSIRVKTVTGAISAAFPGARSDCGTLFWRGKEPSQVLGLGFHWLGVNACVDNS